MSWFGLWSPTWWFGGVVFMGLGLVVLTRYFRFVWAAHRAGASIFMLPLPLKFLSAPSGDIVPWSTGCVVVVMWLGGLLSMISVGIGDANANAPCVAACEEDGWSGGRLRGDPHAPPGGTHEYACWCNNGPEWSDAAIKVGQ